MLGSSNDTEGKVTLTRNDLYNLVWSEPFLVLSKKYSISDVGLRKVCVRMNIPLPKSGHWQKVRSGKKIKIPALPVDYTGEDKLSLSLRNEGEKNNLAEQTPLTILQQEIENTPGISLTVPTELSKPHHLISAAKKDLSKKKPGYRDELVSTSLGELDISVSPGNIERTLCFMDTLIKALEIRGHAVQFNGRSSYVILYGEQVQISFRERRNRTVIETTSSWDNTAYIASGVLVFRMGYSYHLKEWKDGKQKLEHQLSRIIASIELRGHELRESTLRSIRYEEERRKEEIAHREYKQKHDKELAKFRKLLQDSQLWWKTKILREYISSVEEKSTKINLTPEEFDAWIVWARQKADWYDPESGVEDELLNEGDKKEELSSKPYFSMY